MNEPQNTSPAPEKVHQKIIGRVLSTFTETFGLSRSVAVAAVIFIIVVVLGAVFWSIHAAPPHTLTITSGPAGSSYERYAERYQEILRSNGVAVKILPSEGSVQNLQRLAERGFSVDVGFVQTGESDGTTKTGRPLFSLGSIAHQPLLIFYRNPTPVNLLSDFAGKKLAVGPPGSGTRT